LAGHRPQSGDGVIAEVALPRWRYVAGRGLHGRPSVRYRTCRLGAPDAVPRAAKAGAPSKDAWDGPLARRGQLTRSPGGLAGAARPNGGRRRNYRASVGSPSAVRPQTATDRAGGKLTENGASPIRSCCGGGVRGSLSPIALARPTIFAHLHRRLVASGRTVGRQLSPPPPSLSCSCLMHSFGFVALLLRRWLTLPVRCSRVAGTLRRGRGRQAVMGGGHAAMRDASERRYGMRQAREPCVVLFALLRVAWDLTWFLRWCSCTELLCRLLCTRG